MMRKFAALSLLLLGLVACSSGGPEDFSEELDTPVLMGEVLEVALPAALAAGAQETDSVFEQFWRSEEISLQFTSGFGITEQHQLGDFSTERDYHFEELDVDGRKAVRFAFSMEVAEGGGQLRTVLWVPPEPWSPGVTLWANCTTKRHCDMMAAAYETIRFYDEADAELDTVVAVGAIAQMQLPASLAAAPRDTNSETEGTWLHERLRLQYSTGPGGIESHTYAERPGYQESEVEVDGGPATVATFEAVEPSPHPTARNYHAMLLVPGAADRPGLFLLADCASPADCEVMLDAFETLRFVGQ